MKKEICFYCGYPISKKPPDLSEFKKHIDHFVPKSKGGSNSIKNLVPSCIYCNLEKRDMLPNEWRNHCFASAHIEILKLRWLIGGTAVTKILDKLNSHDLRTPSFAREES